MATGTFDLLHPGHGIYLNEAKKLGGKDAKLYVVIARDSTVEKRKRYPIVGEQQRLELVKMIKGVDEAYLGNENGDFLKIVEEIDPDIIAIGADQRHDITKLQEAINKRGLKAKVERVKAYHNAELDSSCKIIKKIKKMHIKDFHKNEESLYHEIFSPIKHQSEMDASAKDIGNDIKDYEWTHRWNNLVTFSSRNSMYHSYVSGFMEKIFVPMLVKYFPDQAGEVVKYIRKAGYGDGEVLDLIDRTAGYNSNTAYLYQGKSGEEHRKKLQQKIRNSCPAASRNANK